FDPPKKGTADADVDGDGERAEEDPSGGINLDELLAELNDMERTEDEHDDGDHIFDEVTCMLEAEREAFLEQTKEIRSALVKVRNVANKTINSSTLLLPAWKKVVSECNLPAKNLPRDVRTRWNSTYDMIRIALKYRCAYREFTNDES
ncbi:hypothetical protein B0H10DRAFT_1631800, partial [Mycena sp. CBHHK59/15]